MQVILSATMLSKRAEICFEGGECSLPSRPAEPEQGDDTEDHDCRNHDRDNADEVEAGRGGAVDGLLSHVERTLHNHRR